jgi:hypothetical protein
LQQMPVEEFAEFVAKQQPSAQSQGLPARLDVLSIEIAGDTAGARRLSWDYVSGYAVTHPS